MTKALETLERLREGNARFRECAERKDLDNDARAALANGQSPSAVIIGCADSRVSPELAFNQGLGELFVIRIAGHVIAAAALESVELAVEQLGAKLVVVLGVDDLLLDDFRRSESPVLGAVAAKSWC